MRTTLPPSPVPVCVQVFSDVWSLQQGATDWVQLTPTCPHLQRTGARLLSLNNLMWLIGGACWVFGLLMPARDDTTCAPKVDLTHAPPPPPPMPFSILYQGSPRLPWPPPRMESAGSWPRNGSKATAQTPARSSRSWWVPGSRTRHSFPPLRSRAGALAAPASALACTLCGALSPPRSCIVQTDFNTSAAVIGGVSLNDSSLLSDALVFLPCVSPTFGCALGSSSRRILCHNLAAIMAPLLPPDA